MTHRQGLCRTKEPIGLFEFVSLFALMTSLTALSLDAMLPALPQIGESLSVQSFNDTQLVITSVILGMFFGELFFGPLSDAIGRKKAILLGLGIFCAGTVVALLAQTMTMLLVGRVIEGIGLAGPKIASRALIRDQYRGESMARIMSFIFMILVLVPMLAPALGQLILMVADWRAIFLSFLIIAMIVAVWFSLRQAETLTLDKRITFSLRSIFNTSRFIFRDVRVMAYTLSAGMIFGSLLIYLSIAQAMFADLYNIVSEFPLYFAILASGIGIASFINGQLVMRYGMQKLSIMALCGLLIFSGIFFLVALLFNGIPPFYWFMGNCYLMFICVGILFGNLNAMAMQSLGNIAGLGASFIAAVSSLVAVFFSVIIGHFYNATTYPMAIAYFIAALVSLVLILRARSAKLIELETK